MSRNKWIREAATHPHGSPERRALLRLAARDPFEEARHMIDRWEDGLQPLFLAVADLRRKFEEASRTVGELDRKGMGGTIASPEYLKSVTPPLEAIAELASKASRNINAVIKRAN